MKTIAKSSPRLTVFFVMACLCLEVPAMSQTPQPIVNLTFDNAPTVSSEINAGDDAHQIQFVFKNAQGVDANLHSAAGLGLTGQANDYAFDNSASPSMGGPGPAGVVISKNSPAGMLQVMSFTITGWFNSDKEKAVGMGARLFDTYGSGGATGTNILLMGGDPAGTLNLGVNGASVTSDDGYRSKNTWVFFAVTYDSTIDDNNVVFYKGDASSPVSLVSTCTLARHPLASFNAICIGNRFSRDRPFMGYIDDFKIFASVANSSGALTKDQIQAVYDADKTPATPAPKGTGSPAAKP